jgi:hypothetical protein
MADHNQPQTTNRLVEGSGIAIEHFGELVRIAPGEPVSRPPAPAVDVSELSSAA